jgi:GLPGLI family protein
LCSGQSSTLVFNAEEWRYNLQVEAVYSNSIDYLEGDFNDEEITTESRKKETVNTFNYYSLNENYSLESVPLVEGTVIKSELQSPVWEIVSDSVQTIEGYQCFLAKGDLCGWQVEAWFTPEVPVTCGPWRLWGLPGLIVNAKSSDGYFDFQMLSLKKTDKTPEKPEYEKAIAKNEYKSVTEKKIKDLANKISALGSDDRFSASVKTKITNPDKCLQ